MKTDNINPSKLTYKSRHCAKINEIKKQSTQEFKQIDHRISPNASFAACSQAIAAILMQGCPDFIAREIEASFYDDKCRDLTTNGKNTSLYSSISQRFSGEECYEVMRQVDKVEEDSTIYKNIALARNPVKKTYRFNGFECAEILEQADKIKDNRLLFSVIMAAKNDDCSPKFSSSEICKILELSDNLNLNVDEIKCLFGLKDKNNKSVFSSSDCINILSRSDTDSLLIDVLKSMTPEIDMQQEGIDSDALLEEAQSKICEQIHPVFDNPQPLSSSLDVVPKVDNLEKYSIYKLINKYANTKRCYISVTPGVYYNADELKKKAESSSVLFKTIMDKAQELSPERFDIDEQLLIIDKLDKIPPKKDAIFLNAMSLRNPDNTFAFSAKECFDILLFTHAIEQLKFELSIVDPQNGNQRFDHNAIMNAPNVSYTKDKKLFTKLALMKNSATNEYRFSLQECRNIDKYAKRISNCYESFEKVLNVQDQDVPRFRSDEIVALLECLKLAEQSPDLFDKLLNEKDNNSYRYSVKAILEIMKVSDSIHKYPEFFAKITSCKNGESYRFSGIECMILMQNISKIFGPNSDFFESIYETKVDGAYVFSAYNCLKLMDRRELIEQNKDLFNEFINNKCLSQQSVTKLMEPETIDRIKKHKKIFDEIFKEQKKFYKKFNFENKMKIFALAEQIEEYPDKWNSIINMYSKSYQNDVDVIISKFYFMLDKKTTER